MPASRMLPVSLLFLFLYFLTVTGCRTGYSYAPKTESTVIKVSEKPDALSFNSLKEQMAPSLADRASKSRGLILGTAVSLATNAVKKMIAKDRKKYKSEYSFALTDLYFYDQLSTISPFDPVGMQFNGFNIIRTFVNRDGHTDTALVGRFELDASDPSEIINNSTFRLRLKSIDVNYTKAKLTRAQKNNINVDIEITFKTSYVNESGQLFGDVALGKFYVLLRQAPLDKKNPAYATFYDKLKDTEVDGKSFIVPRSFGYYKTPEDAIEKSFSQGAYSISVKVTESTRDRFVTKVLLDNSNTIIDMLGTRAAGLGH